MPVFLIIRLVFDVTGQILSFCKMVMNGIDVEVKWKKRVRLLCLEVTGRVVCFRNLWFPACGMRESGYEWALCAILVWSG